MTEEQARSARVVALYKTGLNYRAIAKLIGATRNAVAGILYRARQPPPPPEPVRKPPEPLPPLEGCRWIDGHPNKHGWRWCGKPTLPGQAWCAEHRARIYVPVRLQRSEEYFASL